jgi:transposase InsO family protein
MSSTTMWKFLWQNIICHFGVPRQITVDNGTQFDSEDFRTFYHSVGIQLCFASVRHPKSNGAGERENRIICTGISKRLVGLAKGKWVDELPKIVLAHNTSVSRSTKFNPFKLLYGEEAMTLEEVKFKGPRTNKQVIEEEEQATTKDLLEERRMQTIQNLSRYQKETKEWYNKKVKPR